VIARQGAMMALMGADDGNACRRQGLIYALITGFRLYLMGQRFLTWNLCQCLHAYGFFKGKTPQVSLPKVKAF